LEQGTGLVFHVCGVPTVDVREAVA
jgi:hypothetical protein